MLAVGVVLDALVYHRLLPYQPGWAAVPLGAPRARPRHGARPAAGRRRAALGGARVLRGSLAARPGAGPCPAPARCACPTARTAASSAGPALAAAALVVVAAGRQRRVGDPAADRPPPGGDPPGPARPRPLAAARSASPARSCAAASSSPRTTSRFGSDRHGRRARDRGGRGRRVVLERRPVLGAMLDGINVRRSAVTVRDCAVAISPGATHRESTSRSASTWRPRTSRAAP